MRMAAYSAVYNGENNTQCGAGKENRRATRQRELSGSAVELMEKVDSNGSGEE